MGSACKLSGGVMLSWLDMIVCYALTSNIARKSQIDGDGDGCVLMGLGGEKRGWSEDVSCI